MPCCVPHCLQSARKSKINGNKISYHIFPPPSNATREKWVDFVVKGNCYFKVKKTSVICSEHFTKDSFYSGVASGRRILKTEAIPTIFPWVQVARVSSHNSEHDFSTNNIVEPEKENTIFPWVHVASVSSHNNEHDFPPNNIDEEKEKENTIFPWVHVASVSSHNNEHDFSANNFDEEPEEENSVSAMSDCIRCEDLTLENTLLEKKNSTQVKEIQSLKNKIKNLEAALAFRNKLISSKSTLISKQKIKIKILENRIIKLSPNLESLRGKDNDVNFYTGIPNFHQLLALYDYLNPGENCESIIFWCYKKRKTGPRNGGRKPILKAPQQFLLVLMRLRLGLFTKDLADRFGVCTKTVSNITITWINFMYFKLGRLNIWPSREQVNSTMPESFKKDYPNTRVIIDATEIKVEKSNSLVVQSGTFSTYKSCNTLKGLIGIDPAGLVTFVSNLYSGSISDQELTRRSGLLDLEFSMNDSIMADKGFLIRDMLKDKGITLNIPPFLKDKGQFTEEELEETQRIASLRIHVERRIQRIKCYHIFDRPIPINLCPVVNQMWSVCTILTNMQAPLIKYKENRDQNSKDDLGIDEIDNMFNVTSIDSIDERSQTI